MQVATLKKVLWGVAIAGLLSVLVTKLGWVRWESGRGDGDEAAEGAIDSRLAMQGVDLVSFRGGRLAMGLEAEDFRVRPRPAAAVPSVGGAAPPDDELTVLGARLQLYLDADADSDVLADASIGTDAPDEGVLAPIHALFEQTLRRFPELDRVALWRADGVEVELFRGLERQLVIKAAQASGEPGNPRISFADVVVEHPPSGRSIASPVLWWSTDAARMRLPPGYEVRGPNGVSHGGAASLGLDFGLRPWPEGG